MVHKLPGASRGHEVLLTTRYFRPAMLLAGRLDHLSLRILSRSMYGCCFNLAPSCHKPVARTPRFASEDLFSRTGQSSRPLGRIRRPPYGGRIGTADAPCQ